jgi:DNA-binding NarL/FixJ family response regulator
MNTIVALLERFDLEVQTANSVSRAVQIIGEFEPNVVVTDLNLGTGPDGTDLLNFVAENFPWMGKVILTAHSSPNLAVDIRHDLPDDVTFLIKSLVTAKEAYQAILESIQLKDARKMVLETGEGVFVVSKSQGELLRMLADGMSNAAIAHSRNRSLPATESLIHRLFAALGLGSNPDINQRVSAVKIWQQGKVKIK